MATDGNPEVNDVQVAIFINDGPNFDNLEPEKFFNTTNFFAKPITMELHESIDSMYRFGTITVEDNIGLRERLPITGNKILSILYKNKISDYNNETPFFKIIHFNVMDMKETQASPNAIKDEKLYRKTLKFHLIEAPFYLKYNGSKLQRVFGKDSGDGKITAPTIDKIFETVLSDNLKINSDFIEFDFHEMSKDVFQVSCPFWKPQKFFKYLLDYARDLDDAGNVKFFTTSNIQTGLTTVNLKSMAGMFRTPNEGIVHSYSLVDKAPFDPSIKAGKGIARRNLNQLFYWNFLTYDLSTLTIGLAGGTQLNYRYGDDIGYHYIYDNYEQTISSNKFFGNVGIWNTDISNENSVGYYIGSQPPKIARNYLNNRIIDYNFQIRCEAVCVINEVVQVGDTIGIYYLSSNPNILDGQEQKMDEQMSGGWLVEEIVDTYSNGKGLRKMVLVKDSFFNVYNPITGERNINLPDVESIIGKDSKLGDQVRRGDSDISIFGQNRFIEELVRTVQEGS